MMTEITAKNVILTNSSGEYLIPYTVSPNEGIPTSICTHLKKYQTGKTVTLCWEDPQDTIIDGLTLCTWSHTIIVRKQGAYPETETDGDIIVVNSTRNAYSTTPFIDTLPTTDDGDEPKTDDGEKANGDNDQETTQTEEDNDQAMAADASPRVNIGVILPGGGDSDGDGEDNGDNDQEQQEDQGEGQQPGEEQPEDNTSNTAEYYYRAFPVSVNGVVCYDPCNKFGQVIYEFLINPENSDPDTCVAYLGTNKDYKPAGMDYTNTVFNYGDWKDAFFMQSFRPCMLNPDGTVKYYLNPDNYALQEDGITPSEVADKTQDGNAMVEIDQVWIREVNENGKFHIYIANEKVSNEYDCYTHIKKDGTYRKFIYRSMFDGSNVNNVIRSLSGQTTCTSLAGTSQIAYAQANGEGWDIDEYNLRRMISYLLILISKSLNTQTTFGYGRYSGDSAISTGRLNENGMFYGTKSNAAVKVFHIENWWANCWKMTYGILQTGAKLYYKMCKGQCDNSTVDDYQTVSIEGYIDSNITISGSSGGYIKEMTLIPHLGLVPTTLGGSSSTYYTDGCFYGTSSDVRFGHCGGASNDSLVPGTLALDVADLVSRSNYTIGVSLMYKEPDGAAGEANGDNDPEPEGNGEQPETESEEQPDGEDETDDGLTDDEIELDKEETETDEEDNASLDDEMQ